MIKVETGKLVTTQLKPLKVFGKLVLVWAEDLSYTECVKHSDSTNRPDSTPGAGSETVLASSSNCAASQCRVWCRGADEASLSLNWSVGGVLPPICSHTPTAASWVGGASSDGADHNEAANPHQTVWAHDRGRALDTLQPQAAASPPACQSSASFMPLRAALTTGTSRLRCAELSVIRSSHSPDHRGSSYQRKWLHRDAAKSIRSEDRGDITHHSNVKWGLVAYLSWCSGVGTL